MITDDHLDDLMRDEPPALVEERAGEGWTRETWRQHFIEQGYTSE